MAAIFTITLHHYCHHNYLNHGQYHTSRSLKKVAEQLEIPLTLLPLTLKDQPSFIL